MILYQNVSPMFLANQDLLYTVCVHVSTFISTFIWITYTMVEK